MQHDLELLRKSRIQSLETALAGELPLAHQNVVQHAFKAEVNELLARVQSSLQSRQENLRRQRDDLLSLHGKTREFIRLSAGEAATMKETFERVSDRFARLQAIIAKHGSALLSQLDPGKLRVEIAATRERMLASLFSKGVIDAMKTFFKSAGGNLESARTQSEEIFALVETIYQRFIEEHEFRQPVPGPLALESIVCKSTGWRKSSTSASAPCCAC